MADARVEVSTVQLKGPAGSVTTDKRVLVSMVDLHGPVDKRLVVNLVTLVAPPVPKKTIVSQVQLVGPNSPTVPLYYGSPSGWAPVIVEVPVGGVWVPIGP